MVVRTANALSDLGVKTSLLVPHLDLPFIGELSAAVSIIPLGVVARLASDHLRQYLVDRHPRVLISAKLKDDALAVSARAATGVLTRIIFRVGNPLGYRAKLRARTFLGRWWSIRKLRSLYSRADGYIAVSRGIADDLVDTLRLPRDSVHVLPNPTIAESIFDLAEEEPEHPWFGEKKGPPVLLGIGGLRRQKNFECLVRAFASVRSERPCRLVILGDGRQRDRLLRLATELGVAADLDIPGWQPNPYSYMARASAFVLPSLWEGSPNVLVEAAALGIPLVASDCLSGPREILADGKYGELVPADHVSALAAAIRRSLDHPRPPELTKRAALPYTKRPSAAAYVRALRLMPDGEVDRLAHGFPRPTERDPRVMPQ